MIRSFRHKGLRRLYLRGDARGLPPALVPRIRRILNRLGAARNPHDLRLPGYRLHSLKGDRRGGWSVRVSANLRIVFRFQEGDACNVDLLDYH